MDLIRISAAMVLNRYLTVKLLEPLTPPAERRPRMHADYHLNWGWGKATARLSPSDGIFCLSTMVYKKFLSGAE
jgi:hypothetical protein